jgi:GNAT superfamily N-acetyltransferase
LNTLRIRLGTAEDIPTVAALELEAGAMFPIEVFPQRRVNITPAEVVHAAIKHSSLWVAQLNESGVVGFLLATDFAPSLHIEEMDVAPSHGRTGIGTALLLHAEQEARLRGLPYLTLTTFAHIPWNKPFYSKRGFLEVTDFELFPHLARAIESERERGYMNRLAMRKNAA